MEIIKKIRSEIGKNRIPEAIALLEEGSEKINSAEIMDILTSLKGEYRGIVRKQIIGTLEDKDEVRRRGIISHLVRLTSEIEEAFNSGAPYDSKQKIKLVQVLEPVQIEPMDLIRIVVVSANPKDTFPLNLGEELKRIKQGINKGRYKERFAEPDICYATQFPDLIEALVSVRPHIVHFTGHGDDDGGVVLQDFSGESLPLSIEQTKSLFELVKSRAPLKSVVFNICHSAKQLETMAKVVDYVIGWDGAVEDSKALYFSENFYRTLANNVQELDIEYAFGMGRMSALVLGGKANGEILMDGLHFQNSAEC
jgi:hypothetical protein